MSDIGLPDLRGRVIIDTAGLDDAVGKASRAGSAIGSAVGSFAGNLATGAVDKVVDFVSGSVDAFAELEDSVAANGVLFQGAAGQVEDFASRAGASYGLSQRQAIQAAGTFGTFGKAAGLSGTDLAGFSTNLTGLAGDLASFKGTSTEQAIEAVGAALRGESEPIRAYGVLLDDATLRQEAMALGLTKTTNDALTPQQKVLAAQSAILKQTSDAQGDFARTSDSTANTAKRLTAESENQQAVIGARLAPAFTALRGALITALEGIAGFLDGLGRMASFVSDNATAFLLIGGAIVAFTFMVAGSAIATAALNGAMTVVRVGVAAWTAVQWLLNAALTANPIGLIVVGIALLVGAIILAWQNSETFRNVVLAVWAAVQAAVGAAISFVIGWVQSWIGNLQTAWAFITSFVAGVVSGFLAFMSGIANAITGAGNAIQSFVSNAVARFLSFAAGVGNAINQAAIFVSSLPGRALSALSSLAGTLAGVASSAFSSFLGSIQAGASQAVGFVSSLPGRLASALGSLGGYLFNSGWSLIQGLIDGITSGFRNAVSAVQNGLSNLRSFFPFSPAKRGPFSGSGWTLYSGRAIGDSLAAGLDSSLAGAARAADRGASAVRSALAVDATNPAMLLGAVSRDFAAAVGPNGALAGAAPPVSVRVFIGERELTDIVSVVVEQDLDQLAGSLERGTS